MIRDVRLLLRVAGETRYFVKLGLGGDGSTYLSMGQRHRSARVFSASITIPAGQASGSTDYAEANPLVFENLEGHHIGLKAVSGEVRHSFGRDRRQVSPDLIPRSVAAPVQVMQIYPSTFSHWPVRQPRARDIVLPDNFDWQARAGGTFEDLFGEDAFHVAIWQLPLGAPLPLGKSTVAAWDSSIGRRLVFAFEQSDTDRARGWLERTRTLRLTSVTTTDATEPVTNRLSSPSENT